MESCSKSNDEKPEEASDASVLGILIEKQEVIESTVSLIKKGIADIVPANSSITEMQHIKTADEVEFDDLNKFLSDGQVSGMIKSVVGEDTHKIIGDALGAIKSNSQVEAKQKAFADGIAKLRTNLSMPDKMKARDDPTFNLAMSFVGLKRERLI